MKFFSVLSLSTWEKLFLAFVFNRLEDILEERVNKTYWKINTIYLSEFLSLEIILIEETGEDIVVIEFVAFLKCQSFFKVNYRKYNYA